MARKVTTIKADKARNISFSVNDLIALEEAMGTSAMALMSDADSLGFKVLRDLLYFGLRWEDKELTLEHTGEIMDIVIQEQGIEYLATNLGNALTQAVSGGAALP